MGVGNHTKEVTHLFFIDDTMLFGELDNGVIFDLRCMLMGFQEGP